jgi:tRNA 2-thiouridine synthesizing protein A
MPKLARGRYGSMTEAMLDARGLNCPLPVLRARKAMQRLEAGTVLHVVATDPGAVKDFQAFCEAAGHELIEQSEAAGEFSFRIRKAP